MSVLKVSQIHPIPLGYVNCYLVNTGDGFILVDTGPASQRTALERQLSEAGCHPGTLKLVIATHGDADHVGNCAWLRQEYGAKIALHRAEMEAVQTGDPTLNKKIPHNLPGSLMRFIARRFKLKSADRFTPDVFIEDGESLSACGLDACLLHTPGHSNGSISVLTSEGDLICGDLLTYFGRPKAGWGIFDQAGYAAALEKLQPLNIQTVYPGHSKSFAWKQFQKAKSARAIGVLACVFGILCGLAGLEHGFFEILQGNVTPQIHWVSGNPMIYAIGDAQRFWPYGFEYAYTIIPNFLLTGILAMLSSLAVIVWSVGFVHKKHGWLIFILLSTLQYLVGGGSAQYGPALIVGLAAFWSDSPLKLLRAVLPVKVRQILSKPWLWLIMALAVVFCQSIVTAVFGFFYGIQNPDQINHILWGMLYVMIALLPLTIISAFSQDSLNDSSTMA